MTRLINMDNGGTLTDFCLIDGEEVRYTKTLTTPYGLSRCLLDGLAKVSELAYGEPQLRRVPSTDCIRYSTTQDTDEEAVSRELLARVNDLSACGARRPVIAVSADGEARVRGLLLRLSPSSARRGPAAVLLGTGRRPRRHPPDLAGSAQHGSCTRPCSASCSTQAGGSGRPGPPAVADLPAEADRAFAPSGPA